MARSEPAPVTSGRQAPRPARSGSPAGPPAAVPPGWAAPVTLLLCLAGLGVAGYLSYVHFTTPTQLSCPDTGLINCTKVTTSSESMLFGVIPVAVAGLAYFVGLTLLCLPWAWRRPSPPLRWARLAGVVSGVVMVCYLIYVELLVLHAICLYCTAVHVITFLLFVAVLLAEALRVPGGSVDDQLAA